jgi:uncharacterized protein YgfB (UPF0149 family)
MSTSLRHADLAALLVELGCNDDPCAFHGALCGALCRQKPEDVDPVELLGEGVGEVDPQARAELLELREAATAALTDLHAGFHPLLPEDSAELALRAEALAAWCQGFLYGLAGRVELRLADCSEEVRELVRDFNDFSSAALEAGDDAEVEENAYAELVEYIRVGTQLVYMELHPRPHAAGTLSSTLH